MTEIQFEGPLAFYFHVKFEEHVSFGNMLQGMNFEIISMTMYDSPQDPSLAAVWKHRPEGVHVQSFVLVSPRDLVPEGELFTVPSVWANENLYPKLIASTGTNDKDTVFVIALEERLESFVSEEDKISPVFEIGRPYMIWDVPLSDLQSARYGVCMPRSITLYRGQNLQLLVAATFYYPKSEGENFAPWNWAYAVDIQAFNTQFKAFRSKPIPLRTAVVALLRRRPLPNLPLTHFISLWVDNAIGHSEIHTDVARSSLDSLIASRINEKGLIPIQIQGSGIGSDAVFTVLFGKGNAISKRKWHKIEALPQKAQIGFPQAQLSTDIFHEFEQWVKGWMQKFGVRAGQLAIARNGKLVCARSYTWAEDGYPQTQHKTRFRWASVSKLITYVAALQAFEEQPGGESSVEGILNSKVADMLVSGFVKDPLFKSMLVKDLFAHRSGIGEEWLNGDLHVSDITGAPLPLDPESMMAYVYSQFQLCEALQVIQSI